jgi:hypothetical protein
MDSPVTKADSVGNGYGNDALAPKRNGEGWRLIFRMEAVRGLMTANCSGFGAFHTATFEGISP